MPTSPASSPIHFPNHQKQKNIKDFVAQPHTPTSPVSLRMSSSAHNGNDHDHNHSFPTPPSSHMPASTSAASDMNTQASTPSHSNNQPDTDMTDAPDNESASYNPPNPLQLLCKTPHPISRPHPSQNLVELYSLQGIASTVARKDPVTGEKINKLRKSYEGKVKNFGLSGRNKPTDIQGELLGLMEWPDEMWESERLQGKELERAESGPLMAKLGRALQMMPGKLPVEDHEKWKNLLALDDGNKTPLVGTSKNSAQQAMLKAQASSMRSSAPASPRASHPHGIRPDRPNKKRRYDESSYTGYSEGYQDDDGYSTGGMDSATKKRRKDYPANFDASGGSPGFNNGMLGVGVRSS